MTAKKSKQSVPVNKVAYSYRRFSSRQQSTGSSLPRQLEMAQAVCIEKGWKLIDLPPDEGISAFKITDGDEQKAANIHKGALGAFLKKVERGEVRKGSVLIIEKMDRFSRNYVDLVIPDFLKLLQSGIEIFSCVDKTHYTLADIRKPGMLLQYAVMGMAMANDYSHSMGERIGRAFRMRLAECSKGSKMNLGSWRPRWIDFIGEPKQPGQFKLNGHAETIQRMVREYLAGDSMYSIAKGLIRDNVPTLAGGKWSQGTIGHLLGNESLRGTVTIKGGRLENYYPAAITQGEYDRLRVKLHANVERRGGNAHSDYVANLFRNRCKCSACGGTVTSQRSGPKHLYFCKNRRVGLCKTKRMVNIGNLETDFFLYFLAASPDELLGKQDGEHSAKTTAIQSRITKLDADIAGAVELLGTVAITELKNKLAGMEAKRQHAKAELDALNNSMLSVNTPQAFIDIKALFKTLWTHPTIKLAGSKGHYTAYINKADLLKVKAEDWTRMEKAADELEKAEQVISAALKDNSVRKRLLQLLPSIVSHLVINLEKNAYAVVLHNGKQSEWRKVAAK